MAMTRPRPRYPIRWSRGQRRELWALGMLAAGGIVALIYLERAW